MFSPFLDIFHQKIKAKQSDKSQSQKWLQLSKVSIVSWTSQICFYGKSNGCHFSIWKLTIILSLGQIFLQWHFKVMLFIHSFIKFIFHQFQLDLDSLMRMSFVYHFKPMLSLTDKPSQGFFGCSLSPSWNWLRKILSS